MKAKHTWSVVLMIFLEVAFGVLIIILLIYFFNGLRQAVDFDHLANRNSYKQH